MSVRTSLILGGAVLLGGCWSYGSAFDVVAGAAVRAPTIPEGTYCVLDGRPGDLALIEHGCMVITWDADAGRHHAVNADENEEDWVDVAAAPRDLHVFQLAFEPASAEEEPYFMVHLVRFAPEGMAMLPTPDAEVLAEIAARYPDLDVEIDGEWGEVGFNAGDPADARAFISEAEAAWLEDPQREVDGFFPAEDEDAPKFLARMEALDPALPREEAAEAAYAVLLDAVGASANAE